MTRWGIGHRTLLVTLLPAVLVALILTAYHFHDRLGTLERHANDQARASAQEVATLARIGLSSGDHASLAAAMRSKVTDHETIVHARVRGHDGIVVAEFGEYSDQGVITSDADSSTRTMIVREVVHAGMPAAPAIENPPSAPRLGEVKLVFDPAPLRDARHAELGRTLAVSLAALALACLVAIGISRRVTPPVQGISQAVERAAAGDHSVRLRVHFPDACGHLERGVATMVDEMDASQASLESRVRDATSELQATLRELEARNEELDEARQVAEAASEFKSRFLANISHEIRTPMNSVLGFAELLRDAELDPVHADYVETIHQSARSLLSLLNGILDLSKIESGHMELEFTDMDLNHVLAEIFRLLAPEAFRKGVELVVLPVERDHSRVCADPLRLKQVLLNLASNAVKFTDRGHVLVSATIERADANGTEITFHIEDTGCGISRECRDHLFEAFAQGDTPGKVRGSQTGTGLGLHIASELIFLMNGDLEFESEPGMGSLFKVSLCLEQVFSDDDQSPGPRSCSTRVVLVEADALLREYLVHLFRVAGIRCKPVSSMQMAARLARADDIVAVHVPAPVTQSGSIARLPAEIERTGATVVAYSHPQDVGTREAITNAGYHGILYKTADPEGLRQDLERLRQPPPQHAGSANRADDHGALATSADASTALVIDDHPINCKLMENYLHEECTSIRIAESGAEALFLAGRERFDFILLDLHLPDIAGLEVARRIRTETGPNRDTPIIAVTADTFALHDNRLSANGIADLLVKPVQRRDLLVRIRQHLGSGEPVQPVQSAPAATESGPAPQAGNQVPLIDDLHTMLYRSLPDSRAAIATALESADAQALQAAAHHLHGAVAYCDKPQLQAHVQTVERLARTASTDGSWQEAAVAADHLLDVLDELLVEYNTTEDAAT